MHSDHHDRHLAERFRNGDRKAFEEIFDAYWYSLYRNACAVLRSKEEAEEIVQELFTDIWQKRESLDIVDFSGYLFVAMRRRIIDRSRSKITHAKYWEYCKRHVPTFEETTAEMVSFNELQSTLEENLKRLPEKSQQIFRLNRLEGRSVPEISKFLQLSERAIEYHLTKSIRELKLHMKNFLAILVIILSNI
jgi:RNA polymerase sigma-70 factor (family 1)